MSTRITFVSLLSIMLANQATGVPLPKPGPNDSLIVNGSFEDGPEVADFKALDVDNTSIKGWKVTRGQIDLIGTFWKSADGKRSIDLHGSPGYGGIAQEFPTKKGQKYRVSFQIAGTPNVGERGVIVEAAGEKAAFKVNGNGHTTDAMGWTKKTLEFTAISTTTILEFRTDGTGDQAQGPGLDDVSVTVVP